MGSFLQQSPSSEHRRRRGGFSLIELVIVVVIIGIIGAIAIPRMSRGAAGASDSALKANLAVLRNAIDLFAAEHNGKYPTLSDLPDAMTKYSNAAGDAFSVTKSSTYLYGPYLRSIPSLPIGPQKGAAPTFTATPDSAPDANSAHWVYNAATGQITANTGSTAADESGKLYSSY